MSVSKELAAATLILLLASACTQHYKIRDREIGDYTLVVHDTKGEPLEGVEVFLVNAHEERLGITDEVGILRFRSSRLRTMKYGAVIACHPSFYCGGWRIHEAYFNVDRQCIYIELAPLSVR